MTPAEMLFFFIDLLVFNTSFGVVDYGRVNAIASTFIGLVKRHSEQEDMYDRKHGGVIRQSKVDDKIAENLRIFVNFVFANIYAVDVQTLYDGLETQIKIFTECYYQQEPISNGGYGYDCPCCGNYFTFEDVINYINMKPDYFDDNDDDHDDVVDDDPKERNSDIRIQKRNRQSEYYEKRKLKKQLAFEDKQKKQKKQKNQKKSTKINMDFTLKTSA